MVSEVHYNAINYLMAEMQGFTGCMRGTAGGGWLSCVQLRPEGERPACKGK